MELSRPTVPHGRVCVRVAVILERYAGQGGRGYAVTNDAGGVLSERPGTVRGPDVAYVTDVNTFHALTPMWAETPPVVALEILSPNEKTGRVEEKVR